MTPILYEKDEIDFTSQGLGSLVEIYDVDVEEQRNGLLQLTASYPVSGLRYADISVGRIILAKPNQRDDVHAFRIVSTELDISGYAVTIEADSITYDLTHNLVKHLNASGNGQAFMTALKNAIVNPSIFAFYSDIATSSTTSLDYVNPMEAIMGTTGSFLQIWGGELKRENRRVAMFNRRGRDNVATFRLGKNISGLKYSVDISSLVTRIIPTKSVQNDDQTTITLEGTPVDSQYISNYEQIYTLPLEFTDDTIKTVADLNAAAKGWFTKSANTGRDKPTVTIDIDVLSLQDSADYQDKFKNLESVSLTDTVTVYVPEYGVNVTAIVNELHYDPILDRVTKMTVGTAKQSFADSSRTQLSDLQDKIISVQNQADAVAVSADGKSTNYYGSVEPSHPQEGDTWFWVNGDKSGIKQFVNGDWVDLVDSDTQEKIAASVTEAVTQAKAHTATAIEQNNASQQRVMNDIAKSQADLAIKDGDFNNKAQAMADKALSDAKANAAQVAQEALNSANQNLADARKSLTDGIASEASARNAAVAAANSQAQSYANQAKADALNTIAKEVTDRQSAVSALDTKATNAVNQAKRDITDTINAISAGDRNYILDTGNPKSQTSNGNDNQDIYNQAIFYSPIKNWGVANADYIISFDWTLKTALSSDMQARVLFNQSPWQAQSFNVKAGQLTGHVDLKFKLAPEILTATNDVTGLTFRIMSQMASGNTITYSNLFMKSGTIITTWTPAPEDVVLDYTTKDNKIKETITQYQTINDGKVTKAQTDATTALGEVATKVSQTDYDTKTGDLTTKYTQVKQTTDSQATDIVDIKKTATSQASKINSISSDVDGTKQSISDIKTTQDSQSDKINQITSDVNGTKQSITDIQTKDGNQDTRMGTIETSVSGIKSDFSSYKTTNDGVVKTAQTTAQTAVDGLKNKVSQTDYNTKTGQLQTDLTSTTQTANQAKTDIVSIKQKDGDQDSRMTRIESDASGVKTTVSDLQTAQGKQSGAISTLQQRADGFDSTVTKVNNLAVGGRNLLLDTSTRTAVGPNNANNTPNAFKWMLANNATVGSLYTALNNNTPISVSFDWSITGTTIAGAFNPQWNSDPWGIGATDAPGITVGSTNTSGHYTWSATTQSGWSSSTANQFTLRTDNLQGTLTITNLKFEQGNLPTAWSPAPEDTDNKISTVSQTVDGISSIVSDPTTGLTTRVQTAEGALSKVQGTDIPALQNATFWQPYSSLNFNDYTKQGSFFFNTSAVKTNGPTTSNSWLYLIVEQGTADNSRIKQTAWYDGVNGVKITYVRTLNSGTWSPWYANDNDSVTTISQTNSDIKQEISDRKTGDNNTLQQGKNFTTSQISNSETGMKSFVNQTISGLQIGAIKDDVSSLKSQVNWQQVTFDDINYLNTTGNYLIIGGKGSNSPFAPWFYITVDAPRTDRITQTVWKDSNSNLAYKRSLFDTTWTPWTQVVNSATLLNIFHDSWSLGTTTNDGITKQMITGIMGQPDGTLILKGNSLILDGDTTVTGAFKVSQANIANGAIGTAQIGDAAITSAKIADLDVSKITGDVTNFVKSGWNNAYGSNVTIDGTGMVVSYGNTSTSFENGNVLFKQLADYADGSNQVETIGSISTTHNGTVNNIVIGLYDQTHIPFGSADGKKIGSPTGEIYGGDLIAFGKARDFNGNFDHIFSYSNQTASLKYGITEGFNFRDKVNFNSNEIVSGSVNYNLKIGALKFSGKFDGRYVPVIVATWSGYIGGGIAFGGDNVVAFNQTQATIIS